MVPRDYNATRINLGDQNLDFRVQTLILKKGSYFPSQKI